MDMNLQDFACKISDIVWGGELGWCQPNDSEGLQRLAGVVLRWHKERIASHIAQQSVSRSAPDTGSPKLCPYCGKVAGVGGCPVCNKYTEMLMADAKRA